MCVYAYIRCSTRNQHDDRQVIAMEEYERKNNIKISKMFTDMESGKDFNRKAYKNMVRCIKKGDVILIKSIDRLGRNYNEMIEQWRKLTKIKEVDIIVLDMPILDTTKNKDLLGTFISDLVLQLLSYVAQNERENIKQRQAEGIAAAKAKGVKFGRPKLDAKNYIEVYEKLKCGEIRQKEAVKMMGVSNATYYRIIRELEESSDNC